MQTLQSIVLGLVQGATEFAPVSSSGHLILVPWILGWALIGDPDLKKSFDVALHVGTLLGALAYFRHDVARYAVAWFRSIGARRIGGADERIAWALALGTIPGAIVGATFEDVIQDRLGAPWLIAAMLVAFGVLLVVVDRRARSDRGYASIRPVDGSRAYVSTLARPKRFVAAPKRAIETFLPPTSRSQCCRTPKSTRK